MRWRTRISAAVWLNLRDVHAAEDIFQNVVLKAMTRDVVFDTESALLSWAFISAKREAIDWVRRNRVEKRFLSELASESIHHDWLVESESETGPRTDALQSCLERTPEESRLLLRLRYFEGQSCGEVADRMGIGLQAVYKRLSRLHHSLRQCMETSLQQVESTFPLVDPNPGSSS